MTADESSDERLIRVAMMSEPVFFTSSQQGDETLELGPRDPRIEQLGSVYYTAGLLFGCWQRVTGGWYPDDEITRNALVEAFLVQVRALVELLGHSPSSAESDDIRVEFFISDLVDWERRTESDLEWFEARRIEINKRVAHLTDERWRTPPSRKEWPGTEMADRTAELLRLFVAALDPSITASDRRPLELFRALLDDYQNLRRG